MGKLKTFPFHQAEIRLTFAQISPLIPRIVDNFSLQEERRKGERGCTHLVCCVWGGERGALLVVKSMWCNLREFLANFMRIAKLAEFSPFLLHKMKCMSFALALCTHRHAHTHGHARTCRRMQETSAWRRCSIFLLAFFHFNCICISHKQSTKA